MFEEQLQQAPPEVQEEMGGRRKLAELCDTRWASRANSLSTFKASFSVVVDALDQLAQDGDSKADSYKAAILHFEFIISLIIAQHILEQIIPLSKYLQTSNIDLLQA